MSHASLNGYVTATLAFKACQSLGWIEPLDHQALTRAAFQSGCPQSSWYEGWCVSVSYRAVSTREMCLMHCCHFSPYPLQEGEGQCGGTCSAWNSGHWASGRLGVAFQNNHAVAVNLVLYSLFYDLLTFLRQTTLMCHQPRKKMVLIFITPL